MALTPIPSGFGIATAQYVLNASGQILSTTFGFENGGSFAAAANAGTIASIWDANLPAAGVADTATFVGVHVLQDIGGARTAASHLSNVAGTRTTDSPSPAVSVGVTKQTTFAGRKFRGRFYLPSVLLEESLVSDGGVISGGAVAALQSAMTTMLGDLVTANLTMSLLHHDLSLPQHVLSLEVRGTVRTQRRRQRLS